MDKDYLLTYANANGATFEWFESEEELREFIEINKITHIFEAIRIKDAETII